MSLFVLSLGIEVVDTFDVAPPPSFLTVVCALSHYYYKLYACYMQTQLMIKGDLFCEIMVLATSELRVRFSQMDLAVSVICY